jgi:Zn-dependent peptidase ImmA (M78 family)
VTYSPWEALADHPDVIVGFVPLESGAAWWEPDERVILIDSRLTRVERRCALAHELEHVAAEDAAVDGTADDGWFGRRMEHRVDVAAARRLISLPAFVDAVRWSNRDDEVAEALDVDLDTLRCRSLNFTAEEIATIERELWDEWRSA